MANHTAQPRRLASLGAPARAWRRLSVLAVLLLALAGCGAQQGACGLSLAAELPLLASGGRPMVAVEIAGQKAHLVVDTGLSGLALSEPAIARLGLRRNTGRRLRISGVGGSSSAHPATVTGLRIGAVRLPNIDAAVLPASRAEPAGGGADGLLGMEILQQFDIDLDVPHHRMALYRGRPCPDLPLPMPGPAAVLETQQTRPQRHLGIPLELDGLSRVAMLDTGARRSVVIGRSAGVPPHILAKDRAVLLTGVGPDTVTARLHRFDTLTVGSDSFARPFLVVLDDVGLEFDMVLGMDYLHLRRMFISFSTDRLYIQRPPPH